MKPKPAVACGPDRRLVSWPGSLTAGLLLVLLAVPGCSPDSEGAARAAQDFKGALSAGDASTACSMLRPQVRDKAASGRTCEERLGSLQLPAGGAVLRTESYGRNAIVEFEDDTVFLAVAGSGWEVTGAGCTLRGESSYDCEVGG